MAGAPHDPPSVGVLPTDEQHAADLIDLRIGTEGLSLLAAGSVPLQELLTRVAEYAVRAVPGADGAGVTMFDSGHPDTVVASASFVAELDVIQYRLMEGPCVTAAAEAHTVRSGSLGGERLWPRFGPRAGRLGIHSALSVPLVLADDILGAINIYAHAKDAFDDRAGELAELFALPAAVAVHNAGLLARTERTAAQLQAALTSRSMIDQAIGIIRSRTGGTAEEAFTALTRASQNGNTKLHRVAEQIVEESVRRARARHQP